MIPRGQFDAYNRAVANLSDGASRQIESQIWAWLQTDEGKTASVAECREYAKGVMSGVIQGYDEAAASLAAQWYDKQAEDNHFKLPDAVTATVYDPKRVDETARYQAKKLANGDARGFARYCGELGRNDVLRSLNETIIKNAGRDRKKGVRFARVPTGAETCTFCLMLAGRGAVYHTRKTAGEFRHFHRRCDCKVVPGFEDNPMATLVEGHDPEESYRLWKRFAEIDGNAGLTALEKRLLKGRYGSPGRMSKERGAHPWQKEVAVADILTGCGVDVRFIREAKNAKSPDAYLDGVVYEFKIPDSMGDKTIKNQMKKATGKGTGNLLLSNVANGVSDDVFLAAIDEFLNDDDYKDDFKEIKRILFIGREGALREFKR